MTPTTPISIDPEPLAAHRPGDWIAMHVFYTSNPGPLLVECVAPLVRRLRRRGLVSRWFYIRYWLEGPHIRLRLLPAAARHEPEIRRLGEAAVDDFLRRRPAVYEVDPELTGEMYRRMFLAEYSEEQWRERYGDADAMALQPNNSYRYIEYLPEHDRYGGPAGVELAEWHFEQSSEMALRLLESTNAHVRSVLFGLSCQLMAVMCLTFLPDAERAAAFLQGYTSYWESSYAEADSGRRDLYDKAYEAMASEFDERIGQVHAGVVGGRPEALSGFVEDWAAHCAELRRRTLELLERRELIFRAGPDTDERVPATDPDLALRVLLSSHLHMTNNRLGVTITDEIYLTYVLARAIPAAALGAAAP